MRGVDEILESLRSARGLKALEPEPAGLQGLLTGLDLIGRSGAVALLKVDGLRSNIAVPRDLTLFDRGGEATDPLPP